MEARPPEAAASPPARRPSGAAPGPSRDRRGSRPERARHRDLPRLRLVLELGIAVLERAVRVPRARPPERQPSGHGVVERRAEAPYVCRRPHVTARGALLRRHVGVRADEVAQPLGALDGPREAQVDHPRRDAHHEVVGLQVEVDPPLPGHVVDDRGHVQAERQRLLHRQSTVPLDEPAQRGTLEVLHDQVRVRALGVRVERAQQHRMRQRPKRLDLAPQPAQRVLLLHEVRPQNLCHHHAEAMLVPDQIDLIAIAPAEAP